MNVYERLLKYVVIRTPSNEESDTTPSSQCQFDLANVLKRKEDLGICNVNIDRFMLPLWENSGNARYENCPCNWFYCTYGHGF